MDIHPKLNNDERINKEYRILNSFLNYLNKINSNIPFKLRKIDISDGLENKLKQDKRFKYCDEGYNTFFHTS